MAVEFCGTCGQPLIPDQLFCQHCGSRVDDQATQAGAPFASATPATPGGTGRALYCGACGALVGSQDRICRRCGAPVEPAQGLVVSDPSLSDLPTMRGTPAPQGYQPPSYAGIPAGPGPGYPAQQSPAWGAAYNDMPPGVAPADPPTFTAGGARRGALGQQTPYYAPSGPGGPPHQRGSRWPLTLALALVALALILGGSLFLLLRSSGGTAQNGGTTPTTASGTQTPGTSTPVTPTPASPSPTQVTLTPGSAEALIQQFYSDINNKQYDAAYDLLSTEYQQTQSRQKFIDGFSTTVQDTINIQDTQTQPDGTIRVDVTLQAVDNKNGTDVTTNYTGYYIVELENGQLRIKSGNLKTSS